MNLYVNAIHAGIFIFIYYKIRTTGYTNKTQCKKKKIYKNTQKVHYEVHKNHIIKSTSVVVAVWTVLPVMY